MHTAAPSDHFVPKDGVHCRAFDDEIVLLDLNGGEYYGLDPVGALVWERIREGATGQDAASAVVAAYDVEPERAMGDVLSLIDDLLAHGLIEKEDGQKAH
jgi:hypothetical protein